MNGSRSRMRMSALHCQWRGSPLPMLPPRPWRCGWWSWIDLYCTRKWTRNASRDVVENRIVKEARGSVVVGTLYKKIVSLFMISFLSAANGLLFIWSRPADSNSSQALKGNDSLIRSIVIVWEFFVTPTCARPFPYPLSSSDTACEKV